MQLSHNRARSSPEVVFFPRWVWHPHPCIQLSQRFRDSDRQSKQLIFMIRRSFVIGFHPIIRGLGASSPRIWYASLFAKPRGRYQPFRANSKIRSNASDSGGITSCEMSSRLAKIAPLVPVSSTQLNRPDYHLSKCSPMKWHWLHRPVPAISAPQMVPANPCRFFHEIGGSHPLLKLRSHL